MYVKINTLVSLFVKTTGGLRKHYLLSDYIMVDKLEDKMFDIWYSKKILSQIFMHNYHHTIFHTCHISGQACGSPDKAEVEAQKRDKAEEDSEATSRHSR